MFSKGRGIVLVLLFLAGVINYLDRSAFSVAAPFIQKSFQLNAAQMGLLFSSFFIGYALFNFIGGFLSDKFGPKKVLGYSMTFWSLFAGLTAATFNFVSLFIARVLFGMGEGPLSSSQSKMVNNWFPKKYRARALSISMAGTSLGGAISGPIVGIIALTWGWKVSFVLITIIGLIWTAFWLKCVKDAPKDVADGEADDEKEVQPAPAGKTKTPLSFYLKHPTVLFTSVAFFAYNYILFFFLTWFPSYLIQARGLDIKEMSFATMIPWTVGFLGFALGGFIIDFLYKKTGNAMFSRKVVLVTCLLGAAVSIGFAGLVNTTAAAVSLMAAAVFFLYLTAITYWAIIQDTVEKERVGGVGGFMHFLANTSGIIGPTATGMLVQTTGHFTSAFILAGGLAVIGALCVAFFVKPIKDKKVKLATERTIA
ncbi:MAG: MFS transporter [Paenibacillus macerans]|uniref:MFS transporter n=1 Tax=Paenibacillus TaxID=44249 RepID=UPI0029117525|nr:MFS transporter [Paenibacillus macerans]MDU7472725.1 MFS transporter [Paenibacillus macerans]